MSAALVVGLALTDGPPASLATFWSQHAMLTNLVSSAAFTALTVTVIETWLRRQEARREAATSLAEQRRLTVVRSAAYNAVARAPIAQRRIMWFLVHGGELRRVPEFEIPEPRAARIRSTLSRLGLAQISEHDVMDGAPLPDLADRLTVLAQDGQWRQIVHETLLDAVHGFRLLIARWSNLLLTTEESLGALKDLAEQAEQFSRVFVEFDPRRPASDFRNDELQHRRELWARAFANAVALEEALIGKGGERSSASGPFETPGRQLLRPGDLRSLPQRAIDGKSSSLRLYLDDPATPPVPM